MSFASGAGQELRLGAESVWATAPAAGSGRQVRRNTCDLAVAKANYSSPELRPDHQVSDMRHGLVSCAGTLAVAPSPGSHSDLIAAALRKDFVAGVNSTALTNVTASATGPHFVRAAGSWITDGFKVLDVVRWAGWASPATANNARNYIITALTATDMTVADPGKTTATVTAKAAGDSVTLSVHGKKSYIPASSHTDKSFAFERCYKDITQSEVFLGVKVNGFTFKWAVGGMADLSIPLMGAGYSNATSEYFTTPTAASTTPVLAGSNGGLMAGLLSAPGAIAYVRELTLTLNNNLTNDEVIGSDTIQGITHGIQVATGSLTAYFKDAVMRDYFLNETEVALSMFGTTSPAVNADFIQLCAPRVKFTNASKPDNPSTLQMTLNFQALLNGAGSTTTNSEYTTLSVQDSLAA